MDKKEMVKILEVVLLMKDEVSEYDIMVNYGMGEYLKKARRIKEYIEKK